MTSARKLNVYNWISTILPDVRPVRYLRKKVLRWAGVRFGDNFTVSPSARFEGYGEISFGNRVNIRGNVIVRVASNAIRVGDDVMFGEGAIIEALVNTGDKGRLEIGNRVDVMQGTLLSANGNACVMVGSDCKIAHHVSIKATHHRISPSEACIGGDIIFDDISIGSGCWICGGAMILPGVRIGNKNVVAAGSVVTNDTPDGVLVAGVPAVVKKSYIES